MFNKSKWSIPLYNEKSNVIVNGYYPSTFNWQDKEISKSKLRNLKLIIEPQNNSGGGLPSIDYGCIPYPIFPKERLNWLKQYIDETNLFLVSLGHIYIDRYKEGHKYLIFIPNNKYIFNSISDVPSDLCMVFINNYFCIRNDIIDDSYNYHKVIFKIFKEENKYPSRKPKNYDQFFATRNPISKNILKDKLYNFILNALEKFTKETNNKISILLLDTDPKYGYLILGIKTSPINSDNIEIDDFEYPQYINYEANQIYGNYDLLTESTYRKIIIEIIHKLAKNEKLKHYKSSFGLQLAYGFHDEDIISITKV